MHSPVQTLFAILRSCNRRRELLRLVAWAERKRLRRPARLYRFRLEDEEQRLSRYGLHHPTLCRIAWMIHDLNTLCFPPSASPRRGLAGGYRRRAMAVGQ
ncbi:MAG: hypothetical protein JNM70_20150 [Anaerolineae bacterium]|nr:hypothetical protein [Anaerolineae bacterium]